MNIKLMFSICFYVIYFMIFGQAIRWLAMRHSNILWDKGKSTLEPSKPAFTSCKSLRIYYGFSYSQIKQCRRDPTLMPHVQTAAALAASTCKRVFQNRRWNCSSLDSAPHITPDLSIGTREQAYVYALSSAALTYVMAKACANESYPHCTCATHPKSRPKNYFKWGGCADNVQWAVAFNKRFLDTPERHIYHDTNFQEENSLQVPEQYISAMNLHNNQVGRRLIAKSLTTECKCHGVSGSCTIKTCWKSLQNLTEVGGRLLWRYIHAIDMSRGFHRIDMTVRKSPSLDQLIYVTKSSDYCIRDTRLGSVGTTGRKCSITTTGADSCSQLCCGRGYKTVAEEKLERCRCKYFHCCYVQCDTCKRLVEFYECL